MALSWNEIKSRAIEFSKEWENETREDAEAKSFWDAFFNIFGMSRKRLASFEEPVKLLEKKTGYIDLFWKGNLIVEHKSAGKDLDAAYTQATDYFEGIKERDLPNYILVSDFQRFRLYDLETKTQTEFNLNDLVKHVRLFGFIAGYSKQEYKPEDPVNIKAAEKLGALYDSIAESGYGGHSLKMFLVRILFCLFADDTTIFNAGTFRHYIENKTNIDGTDLGGYLTILFQTLNTPVEKRQKTLDEDLFAFQYVNGGLFAENLPLPSFNRDMREKLIDACAFDWSKISPAIFGSMFQSVMDKSARRHLGAHYTSETNILKLIKPLFLDELKIELDACGKNIQKLQDYQNKLASLKFLDPACGCGNFLIIAYRELRLLELEMLKRRYLYKDNIGTALPIYDVKNFIKVRPEQFYGIEVEEFPARIAQTAIWLMDHQMNDLVSIVFGHNYARLPLTDGAKIVNENALKIQWSMVVPKNELSYILGNPPFIGSRVMEPDQKSDMLEVFGKTREMGFLDYVTAWYYNAAQYIQGTKIKCAFVSTNSITQGEQAGILWDILLNRFGIKIHFAHRTFKWTNEARGKAAVYCVIIGFANFDTDKKWLYEYEDIKGEPHELKVRNINPYLVDADDMVIRNRQKAICDVPEISFGNMPRDGGYLIFTDEEKNELIKSEPDANKLLRRFIGAKDFLHNEKRWCLWLVDAQPDELQKLPEVLKHIEAVKDFRLASKAKSTRDFARTPALFAQRTQPKSDYILIPSTSSENRKYIPMGFISKDSIVANSCHAVSSATLYHFGVLESEMHMAWVRQVCGRLKSDFRYSKDIVYNNFPWPENSNAERIKAVESAAQKVLDTRLKYPNSSLADLYNPLIMAVDLLKAHEELDRAVDSAYSRKIFKSDSERLGFLFEMYRNLIKIKTAA
jgi:hypothetical protein